MTVQKVWFEAWPEDSERWSRGNRNGKSVHFHKKQQHIKEVVRHATSFQQFCLLTTCKFRTTYVRVATRNAYTVSRKNCIVLFLKYFCRTKLYFDDFWQGIVIAKIQWWSFLTQTVIPWQAKKKNTYDNQHYCNSNCHLQGCRQLNQGSIPSPAKTVNCRTDEFI